MRRARRGDGHDRRRRRPPPRPRRDLPRAVVLGRRLDASVPLHGSREAGVRRPAPRRARRRRVRGRRPLGLVVPQLQRDRARRRAGSTRCARSSPGAGAGRLAPDGGPLLYATEGGVRLGVRGAASSAGARRAARAQGRRDVISRARWACRAHARARAATRSTRCRPIRTTTAGCARPAARPARRSRRTSHRLPAHGAPARRDDPHDGPGEAHRRGAPRRRATDRRGARRPRRRAARRRSASTSRAAARCRASPTRTCTSRPGRSRGASSRCSARGLARRRPCSASAPRRRRRAAGSAAAAGATSCGRDGERPERRGARCRRAGRRRSRCARTTATRCGSTPPRSRSRTATSRRPAAWSSATSAASRPAILREEAAWRFEAPLRARARATRSPRCASRCRRWRGRRRRRARQGRRPRRARAVRGAARAGDSRSASGSRSRPTPTISRARDYVKAFMDGTLGSRTARLLDGTGVEITAAEELAELIRRAAAHDLPLAVHAIGDRANRDALDAFAATRARLAPGAAPADRARAVRAPRRTVPRFAALGVTASVQFTHATSDRDVADRLWGGAADHAYPYRCAARRGRASSRAARTRRSRRSTRSTGCAPRSCARPATGPPWRPEQALALDAALAAFTTAPAWLEGAEARRGRLAPGLAADVVVLDRDPSDGPRGRARGRRRCSTATGSTYPEAMRVLVVDDEPAVRQALERALAAERHDVARRPPTAAPRSTTSSTSPSTPSCSTSRCPGVDGLEVCRRLRAAGDRTPVLMLTARDAVDDRVAGLDAGADDYLVKPFALKELKARLRALRPPRRAAGSRRPAALRRPRARPRRARGAPWRPPDRALAHRVRPARAVRRATRARCSRARRSSSASGATTSARRRTRSASTSATCGARRRRAGRRGCCTRCAASATCCGRTLSGACGAGSTLAYHAGRRGRRDRRRGRLLRRDPRRAARPGRRPAHGPGRAASRAPRRPAAGFGPGGGLPARPPERAGGRRRTSRSSRRAARRVCCAATRRFPSRPRTARCRGRGAAAPLLSDRDAGGQHLRVLSRAAPARRGAVLLGRSLGRRRPHAGAPAARAAPPLPRGDRRWRRCWAARVADRFAARARPARGGAGGAAPARGRRVARAAHAGHRAAHERRAAARGARPRRRAAPRAAARRRRPDRGARRARRRPDRARARRPARRGGRRTCGSTRSSPRRVERARRHAPHVTFATALDPVALDGVPERLGRAVNNLLDNAASPRRRAAAPST